MFMCKAPARELLLSAERANCKLKLALKSSKRLISVSLMSPIVRAESRMGVLLCCELPAHEPRIPSQSLRACIAAGSRAQCRPESCCLWQSGLIVHCCQACPSSALPSSRSRLMPPFISQSLAIFSTASVILLLEKDPRNWMFLGASPRLS